MVKEYETLTLRNVSNEMYEDFLAYARAHDVEAGISYVYGWSVLTNCIHYFGREGWRTGIVHAVITRPTPTTVRIEKRASTPITTVHALMRPFLS